MRLDLALQNVRRLFLDSAPVLYYGQLNTTYLALTTAVFRQINQGRIEAVTSAITLAECLIVPYRLGSLPMQQLYRYLVVNRPGTIFVPLDSGSAEKAAELRARYNLSLPDALQVAAAVQARCDAFLTNDKMLRRVSELPILILDDLTL